MSEQVKALERRFFEEIEHGYIASIRERLEAMDKEQAMDKARVDSALSSLYGDAQVIRERMDATERSLDSGLVALSLEEHSKLDVAHQRLNDHWERLMIESGRLDALADTTQVDKWRRQDKAARKAAEAEAGEGEAGK